MQTTINISLDVPQSYQLDTLKQELTEYAKKLVAKAKPKAKIVRKQYAHDVLCGIMKTDMKTYKSDKELIEEYLKEKFQI